MLEDEDRDDPTSGSGPGVPPDLRGRSFARLRASRRRDAAERGRLGRSARGVHAFFTRELWARELATLPTFRRWAYGVARVIHLTVTNFVKDRCTWRAAALTYITVLSLVPMLAFAFSVAKGLGAYEQLERETIVLFLDATFEAGVAAGDFEVPETTERARRRPFVPKRSATRRRRPPRREVRRSARRSTPCSTSSSAPTCPSSARSVSCSCSTPS